VSVTGRRHLPWSRDQTGPPAGGWPVRPPADPAQRQPARGLYAGVGRRARSPAPADARSAGLSLWVPEAATGDRGHAVADYGTAWPAGLL